MLIAFPDYKGLGIVLIGVAIGIVVLLFLWFVVARIMERRGSEPKTKPVTTEAHAGLAEGRGEAPPPTVEISDAIEAQITRGPANPGTNEVNWTTQGQRSRHIHLDFKPRALRFFHPVDVTVTTVPATVQVGSGQLIVTRFFDAGFMVDEIGTTGDVVRVEPYRD